MRLDDLIARLQSIRAEHGNLDVFLFEHEFGDQLDLPTPRVAEGERIYLDPRGRTRRYRTGMKVVLIG